tara:strand:+ start:1145 stop:1744 length:600 start_codon:yes stop_codon:yes gene_type:complete
MKNQELSTQELPNTSYTENVVLPDKVITSSKTENFSFIDKFINQPNGISLKKYKTFRDINGEKGINVDLYFKNHKTLLIDLFTKSAGYQYKIINRTTLHSLYNLLGVSSLGELNEFVDYVINKHTVKKFEKKGIIVLNDKGFHIVGFSVSIPTFLKKYSSGLEALQNLYDDLKVESKTTLDSSTKIVNTNYLKSIGIKL